MRDETREPATLTTAEYASMLRINNKTLIRWIKEGRPGIVRPVTPDSRCLRFSRRAVMRTLDR